MRLSVFTKVFGALAPAEVARALAATGVEAANLLARTGGTADPEVPGEVSRAVAALRAGGVDVPMVTTDIVRDDDASRRLLAEIADTGVSRSRLGFFTYDAGLGYDVTLALARQELERLASYAASLRIELVLQLHQHSLHASAALARRLVDGIDDKSLRLALDPANQAVEGSEDVRVSLDLIGARGSFVGVKDVTWERSAGGFEARWTPLGEGVVAWRDVAHELIRRGFDDFFDLHVFHASAADAATRGAADVKALRAFMEQARRRARDDENQGSGT